MVAPVVIDAPKGMMVASSIAEANQVVEALNKAFGVEEEGQTIFEVFHSGLTPAQQREVLERSRDRQGRHWMVGVLTQDRGVHAPWLTGYIDLNRTVDLGRMLHRLGVVAERMLRISLAFR